MNKRHKPLSSIPRAFSSIGMALALTLLVSGCSVNALQQREQAVASQEQQLVAQQQQLEQEKSRLEALEAELQLEKKRLEVLRKKPISSNGSVDQASVVTAQQLANNRRILVGELEHVYISPPDMELTARIDTGAKTSSLNAQDLVEFERDGKAHARFNILDPHTGKKVEIERRIVKWVRIKEHEGDYQRRPIVKMRVRLGELDQHIEMTLADRSEFDFQALIGRNYLRDFAIVDVSKKFLSQPAIEKK